MIRLLLLAAFLVTACGDETVETTLGGSASRVHSLAYQEVRSRLTSTEFAIQYLDSGEVPVQVVVDLTVTPIDGPGTIDLQGAGDVTGSREMSRLPEFLRGTLELTAFEPIEGARVAGEFQAEVGDTDRSYAVFGSFDTRLEVLGTP